MPGRQQWACTLFAPFRSAEARRCFVRGVVGVVGDEYELGGPSMVGAHHLVLKQGVAEDRGADAYAQLREYVVSIWGFEERRFAFGCAPLAGGGTKAACAEHGLQTVD